MLITEIVHNTALFVVSSTPLMLCEEYPMFIVQVLVELYWKHAPLTCRNFAELARRGYYNGTKFHRIIKVL